MEEEYEVQVYIYDMSRGLAQSLSPVLLGRQIDGVWHTGIVVYGEEYYYGGLGGIEACPPGGTILGQPTEIVSLGKTQLTRDIFLDFLHELSQTTFRPTCYHLLDHNCNTFSNEVANFLTGQNIPAKITNLPHDIMQTPFGAMLKPFIDSMTAGPEGGHALFGDDNVGSASSSASQAPAPAAAESSSSSDAGPALPLPELVTYSDPQITDSYVQQTDSLRGVLRPVDFQLVGEVYEYLLVTGEHTWSLGPPHLRAMCRLIGDATLPSAIRQVVAGLLQVALLSDDVVAVCAHDSNSPFVDLVSSLESLQPVELTNRVAKCICNVVSTKSGADWFASLRSRESPEKAGGENPSESPAMLAVVCHQCLLQEDHETCLLGGQIVSNVLHFAQKLSPEMAFDLGVTLIEACKRAEEEKPADIFWFCLCSCIRFNPELAELAEASELVVGDAETKFPAIVKYTSAVRKYLHPQ